jgi:hypothetical protein
VRIPLIAAAYIEEQDHYDKGKLGGTGLGVPMTLSRVATPDVFLDGSARLETSTAPSKAQALQDLVFKPTGFHGGKTIEITFAAEAPSLQVSRTAVLRIAVEPGEGCELPAVPFQGPYEYVQGTLSGTTSQGSFSLPATFSAHDEEVFGPGISITAADGMTALSQENGYLTLYQHWPISAAPGGSSTYELMAATDEGLNFRCKGGTEDTFYGASSGTMTLTFGSDCRPTSANFDFHGEAVVDGQTHACDYNATFTPSR